MIISAEGDEILPHLASHWRRGRSISITYLLSRCHTWSALQEASPHCGKVWSREMAKLSDTPARQDMQVNGPAGQPRNAIRRSIGRKGKDVEGCIVRLKCKIVFCG